MIRIRTLDGSDDFEEGSDTGDSPHQELGAIRPLIWPVPVLADGRLPRVSQGFKLPEGTHAGVDIMYPRIPSDGGKPGHDLPQFSTKHYMPNGVPALAIDDGVVTIAKMIGTGGQVNVRHPSGLVSQYFHLRGIRVKSGDAIKQGQPVGEISRDAKGFQLNHLHFQVRDPARATAIEPRVDPEPYLASATPVANPWGRAKMLAGAGVLLLGATGGYLAWRLKNR